MAGERAARVGVAMMVAAAVVLLVLVVAAPTMITDSSEGIDFVPQIVLVFVAGAVGAAGYRLRVVATRRTAEERFTSARVAIAREAVAPTVSARPDPFFRAEDQSARTADAEDTSGVA